jgi:hypothetical protein
MVYFYAAQKVLFYIAHTQTITHRRVFCLKKERKKEILLLGKESALFMVANFHPLRSLA